MRYITEYIIYNGAQWQVKHRCNYDNLPEDWRYYKVLVYEPWLDGKEVLLLHSAGYPVKSMKQIISVESYFEYVKKLKLKKGYRRVTYKDIENGSKVCLRDNGEGQPSYEFDYNFVGGPVSNKESDPKWINISTSPTNTYWARLHDLCIKR
jgi:hypothetical protein